MLLLAQDRPRPLNRGIVPHEQVERTISVPIGGRDLRSSSRPLRAEHPRPCSFTDLQQRRFRFANQFCSWAEIPESQPPKEDYASRTCSDEQVLLPVCIPINGQRGCHPLLNSNRFPLHGEGSPVEESQPAALTVVGQKVNEAVLVTDKQVRVPVAVPIRCADGRRLAYPQDLRALIPNPQGLFVAALARPTEDVDFARPRSSEDVAMAVTVDVRELRTEANTSPIGHSTAFVSSSKLTALPDAPIDWRTNELVDKELAFSELPDEQLDDSVTIDVGQVRGSMPRSNVDPSTSRSESIGVFEYACSLERCPHNKAHQDSHSSQWWAYGVAPPLPTFSDAS